MRSNLVRLTFAATLIAATSIAAVASAAGLNLNVDILGGHIPPAAPPNGNVAGLFTGAGPGGGGSWNALTVLDHGAGAGENGTYNNQTVFDPSNAGGDNPSYVAASGPFVYSNGATASGVSITLANFVSSDDQTPGQPGGYGGGNGNKLLDAYLVQADSRGVGTVTISGLASGSKYDVYAFGSNGAQGVGAQFTVGGNTAGTTAALPPSSSSPFVQGRDYQEFTNVVATGGSLTINVAGVVGIGVGVINGFQLVSVPEPGSIVLMGLAAVALGLSVRRRVRR